MDMRCDWSIDCNNYDNNYYSCEETTENVKDNFNLRRFYSSEGYDILINGVEERCLIQTSSNPLRELNDSRIIHCPITANIKRGHYVQHEDSTWIVDTNVVNVDGAYYTARMSRCQYLLRWQNRNGKIVERWAYASDQTKYSNGEKGSSTLTIGDNQYGLLLPIDEETKFLKRNMRFSFDFDDAEEPDIYELTNRKVNLNEGTMLLSFSFSAFDKNSDKQITLENGVLAWICDYNASAVPSLSTANQDNITYSISGNSKLKYGIARNYTAIFTDEKGNSVAPPPFMWNVVSNFDISQATDGNQIRLQVKDKNCINKMFQLQLVVGSSVVSEIVITVVDNF